MFYLILSLMVYLSCPLDARNSYSLVDSQGVPLDLKLRQLMSYRDGVFIEVGAHDGITQSNTKLLEKYYGWTGVLIEPSEVLFSKLCANRSASRCFQCALGSFEENGTFAWGDFDGGSMASIGGTRTKHVANQRVFVRSLQSILDELDLRHINFFSLDTEGYELNILKGIDFSKTTFDYLLIEIYLTQYDDIISFLLQNGYEMVSCFSNYNHQQNPRWDGTHNDYLFKRVTPSSPNVVLDF